MSSMLPDATDVPQENELERVEPPRGVSVGQAVGWIGEGWRLFARSPVMWIIAIIILFVIAFAMGLVPIIGQVAFQVLSPVFSAGFVVAARAIEKGGEFELDHLFAGFRRQFGPLAMVGAIFLVLGLVVLLVLGVFFGFSIVGAFMAGDPEQMWTAVAASSLALVLGVLVCLALFIPILAAYWFAPPLVMMHGMRPVEAMKASFSGSLRNIVPLIVYGIVMMVLGIVAMIPFGLGMFVWVPLLITSSYAAYRSIFTAERAAAPPAPAV